MSRADHPEPPAQTDPSPLPAEEEARLLEALEAALRPSELSPALNERLIEMALEDPLAPPSAAELIESERLRSALDDGSPHEDARLLAGLRAGLALDDDAVESAVERALPAAMSRPRRNVVYAVFGAGGALAAAAAVLLFATQTRAPDAAIGADTYARPRSTSALFSERFETGDTTARMDLIAGARSRDLRHNRYAAWGVR